MSEISKNENTFIRSTPSRGSLGGVSFGTREAAIILDSAGYDFIFIETVGVGQSEIIAANLVDIFCSLTLSYTSFKLFKLLSSKFSNLSSFTF